MKAKYHVLGCDTITTRDTCSCGYDDMLRLEGYEQGRLEAQEPREVTDEEIDRAIIAYFPCADHLMIRHADTRKAMRAAIAAVDALRARKAVGR